MFGRPKDQHDERLSDPVPGERSSASAESRLPDDTTTTAGPSPVPRHLLAGLRDYPRLRDLVVGYLLLQERMRWAEGIRSDLDVAGESPDREFWVRLDPKLGAEGLRADFPNSLLGDQMFEPLVSTFDREHGKAKAAAAAGRNPHQSAQSAEEAYNAVHSILVAAEALAVNCKAEARRLLEVLYKTVMDILADEEEPPTPVGATERSTGASPRTPTEMQVPTRRGTDEKHLQGAGSVPDVVTHLLSKGEPHERDGDRTD